MSPVQPVLLRNARLTALEAGYRRRPMDPWAKCVVDSTLRQVSSCLTAPSFEQCGTPAVVEQVVTSEVAYSAVEQLLCVHLSGGTHPAHVPGQHFAEAVAMLRASNSPMSRQEIDRLFFAAQDATGLTELMHYLVVLTRAMARSRLHPGFDFLALAQDIALRFSGFAEVVRAEWSRLYLIELNS